MNKKISTTLAFAIIIVLAALVGGGIFMFRYHLINVAPIEKHLKENNNTVPASSKNQDKEGQSILKCSNYIETAINELEKKPDMEWLAIRYIKAEFFDNAQEAKSYLISQGFENPIGHGALDLKEASAATRDFIVASIGLKSEFSENVYNPDSQDYGKKIFFMEATQPIICINGNIGKNSKLFLTEALLDVPSTRFNIYYKGKIVE